MNKATRLLMLLESEDFLNQTDLSTKEVNTEFKILMPKGTSTVKGNIYGYIGVAIDDDRNAVFTHLPTGRSFFTIPRIIMEQIVCPLESDSIIDALTDMLKGKELSSLEPYTKIFNAILKKSNGVMTPEIMPKIKASIDKINAELKGKLKDALDSGEIDKAMVDYYVSGKRIPSLR